MWVDEDGVKHILKNGKEIDLSEGEWTDKGGEIMKIDKGAGKVIIITKDGSSSFTNEGGEHTNIMFFASGNNPGGHELHEIKVWVDEDGTKHIMRNGQEVDLSEMEDAGDKGELFFIGEKGEGKNGGKVMVYTSDEESDGEHKTVTIEVISKVVIHLEDVTKDDFSNLANIDAKTLKTDELNFYPNSNNGQFTLQFKTNKKPTEVKITNLDGKTVYVEELQNFAGTYQNEIDLSGQKKGLYLLQIIQGNRAINKKIVIE